MMTKFNPLETKTFITAALGLTTALLVWSISTSAHALDTGSRVGFCNSLFKELEAAIDDAGVRNSALSRVANYPFLRTNRFLDEMGYFTSDRTEANLLLNLLFQEGIVATRKEIDNLPDQMVSQISSHLRAYSAQGYASGQASRESLQTAAQECSEVLLSHLKQNQGLGPLALRSKGPGSEYRLSRRILGLYYLITPAIGVAVKNYKSRIEELYAIPFERLKPQGTVTRLSPETESFPEFDGLDPWTLLAAVSGNPLQIPYLDEQDLRWMAQKFAPILEQDVTGAYDRPGTVVWKEGLVSVNTQEPTVYYYSTHALIKGVPHLQLNYVIWYSERPRVGLIDIEAGRMHGLTLRMTLDKTAEPIMVDVIHNCGCYHFFFPSGKIFAQPKTRLVDESAFVPQWLPPDKQSSRLNVRVGARRHFVERLHYTESKDRTGSLYKLEPYDVLEALPDKPGSRESIFTSKGIVKGDTERPERFILFSVGIPEIGSMRQRGHHGTALIGQRMFDDPRLFEKHFFLR